MVYSRRVKLRLSSADISFFVATNALVLGAVVYAYVLESRYPDFYYFSVQEDEYLEWSTFWAFLLAAGAFVHRAIGYRRITRALPWFLTGVALFCFVVAMEEVSWGQRLLGYRPPAYFLEHNYQQELNIHNVVETDYRKLALTLVIAAYGIGLPLLARIPIVHDWFRRLGIVAPAIALLPAFFVSLVLYVVYPWSHSGEWVEMILGLGFLFAAVRAPHERGDAGQPFPADRLGQGMVTTISAAAVIVLGLVSAAATRTQRDANPANVQAAIIEVHAIASDLTSGLGTSECNLHKRLYTFIVEYHETGLLEGSYFALKSQGLPAERAEFFLDPWNSPYWIRDRCDDKRTAFVYSFGPNRRRDSTHTEILGDDIGAFFTPQDDGDEN